MILFWLEFIGKSICRFLYFYFGYWWRFYWINCSYEGYVYPKFETLTQNKENFDSFKKSIFKLAYLLFIPIGFIILTFSYFFSDSFSFLENVAENGLFSLFVIVLGFSILSYCFAFEHVLLQINYPKEHTKSLLILFASNLILNILLINMFGINGAAFATILAILFIFCK